MSELSVHFNRLSVGPQQIDLKEMFPPHRERLERCLLKIFQQSVPEVPSKDIPFRIQLQMGRPTLRVGDREIPLEKSEELSRIQRIVRYYQHTGQLTRGPIDPKAEAQRNRETQKSVQAINQASIPGANGSILAGLRLADDSLTLARNILFAIPDIGPNDPVVNHLGYYAGIFWAFFAFRELDDGIVENRRSKTIGDAEGKRRAEARILSGGLVSAGSLAYLGAKFCDTLASTSAVSIAMNVSNALFGAGALLGAGVSVLGAMRCQRFDKRLCDYLENPKLGEAQKLKGAVRFLKDSITVTSEERAELLLQIDRQYPQCTLEQKEKIFRHKLRDLTEVKVKYMKRRTSNQSLRLILNQADSLIAKLSDPKTCAQGIKEATMMINTIRQENRIKLLLYILGFIGSILGFVGTLTLACMSAGALPFVLYSISGTLYVLVSLYTVAGLFIKKEPAAKNPDLLYHSEKESEPSCLAMEPAIA